MKNIFTAAILGLAIPATAQASTVDLTDGVFTTVASSSVPGRPVVFSEIVDGITFTFTALDNLVGITSFLTGLGGGMSNGLRFGGGAGSTTSWSISASADVILTSYSGFNSAFLNAPELSVSAGGSALASGAPFSASGFSAAAAGVESVPSGLSLFPRDVPFTFDVTNPGVITQGYLTGFTFDVVPAAAVPLPAGLPLMAAALGVFGWLRRRKA